MILTFRIFFCGLFNSREVIGMNLNWDTDTPDGDFHGFCLCPGKWWTNIFNWAITTSFGICSDLLFANRPGI
jgi:hypothetical protein